ncbi:MAG: urease accessory UreF family protein [Paracoccaceae bacterium]
MGMDAPWGMIMGRMVFHMPMAKPCHLARERLQLAQLLSPAFPIGAFAHSQGLENAIAEGRVGDASALYDWLHAVLRHGAGRLDAAFLVAARAPDADHLALAALYLAYMPSAERHQEALEMGRGFQTLVAAITGTPAPNMPYAIAVGRATQGLSLSNAEILALWLQGLATQLISVAVRFMPLGQSQGQRLLARLSDDLVALAEETATAPFAAAFSFTPGADMASMRHETQEVRIFRT